MSKKQEVAIADIETELSRLWDEEKNKERIKACLFNLIVYTQDEKRTPFLEEITNAIIEKFPCRIIFIQGDTDPTSDYLRASVSTEMSGTKNEAFGCDHISIEVSSSRLRVVPFIILPHLVPDLPVYLIWAQEPTAENEILPYVQKFAHRLIFDPGCTTNLQRFSQNMLARMSSVEAEIVDLNWVLVSGWREALLRTFDTEERIRQFSASKVITITYNDAKSAFFQFPEIQAIYLNCWIAAQMGWQFVEVKTEGTTRRITYANGASKVEIALVPQGAPELFPGTILSVEVAAAEDLLFAILRKGKLPKVVVHMSTSEICELPFTMPLRNTQIGLGFIKGLFFQPSCAHYRSMLKVVSQIDWRL